MIRSAEAERPGCGTAMAEKVQIESVNAGCRILGKDKQNWNRQSCKVSKSTSIASTICKCNTDGTSSFSVTSDIFVPPRKLDFDTIKATTLNKGHVSFISFSMALVTIYLFGLFIYNFYVYNF